MNRREFTRRASLLAIATAGSGMVAACDGDGDNAAPAPAPSPTPTAAPLPTAAFASEPLVLSEPMLQLPTADSVRVVWFTEFKGRDHAVRYGANFGAQVAATSTPLSRMYEDAASTVAGRSYTGLTQRDIWTHIPQVNR